jgi:hypothetical protein
MEETKMPTFWISDLPFSSGQTEWQLQKASAPEEPQSKIKNRKVS